ncbi:methyltransferase domain-containing protein [Sarocladium implicatum]|nr:methyltransferase domain-containing protein [Sarocladium implicatum]
MADDFTPIPISEAERIARHAIIPKVPNGLDIEVAQVEHRIEIINSWRIKPGSRVLEVGCGQGTCTTVLAEFVGPNGHVDAFDNASLDYGAPFTLGEAQSYISRGEMGSRITWHNEDLAEFLKDKIDLQKWSWDYIVFCHSLWYFDSRAQAAQLLRELRHRAGEFLVAEYAMAATEPRALPHVFASIARGMLESCKATSDENIRSLFGPLQVKDLIEEHGWAFSKRTVITPGEGLLDGSWEVGTVKSTAFLDEIEAVEDPRQQLVLKSAREAVLGAVERIGKERVRTMDVWAASYGLVGYNDVRT